MGRLGAISFPLLGFSFFAAACRPAPGPSVAQGNQPTPLRQEVYVWQRSWNPDIGASVRRVAGDVSRFDVLVGEVEYGADGPRSVRVPVDWREFTGSGASISAVIRLSNPRSGSSFATLGPDIKKSVSMLAPRGAFPAAVDEIQFDFDCPTSKLDLYVSALREIRPLIAPNRLVVTALPAWLESPAFPRLAAVVDAFVLQLHSLSPPRKPGETLVVFDPDRARAATRRASDFGIPFRVSLPTYGYGWASDSDGRLSALRAERDADRVGLEVLRESRSDPAKVLAVVREWAADSPKNLTGVAWFRLPIDRDRRNWSLRTFEAVLRGRLPAPRLVATSRANGALLDVELFNEGDGDADLPASIRLRFEGARVVAADATALFSWKDDPPGSLLWAPRRPPGESGPIAPGGKLSVGWARFDVEHAGNVRVSIDG